MHFLWKVFIVFVLAQVLGCFIWWRRVGKSSRLRLLLICLFLAGNLPWILFLVVFTRPNPPSTWIASLILRIFATWQVGLVIWLAWVGFINSAILIFFRLPLWVARGLNQRPIKDGPANPSRRAFVIRAARGTAWGVILSSGVWGLVRSEINPHVVRRTIFPPGLPKTLDGLTVAHLSDLHIGFWTPPEQVPSVLAITGELKPDLVAITGDIIDHKPSFSQALVRHLYLLNSVPLGIYAILGNHDIYTGAEQISEALKTGRVTMLRDRYYPFYDQGLPLALVGVNDPGGGFLGSAGGIKLDRAMQGLRPDLFPILLTHRPTGFEQACEAQIPLTLCGHTHGGQIGIPGLPNLADLAYDYTHGLYKKKGCLLHVSAGIGTVGLPMRVGVPAEIVLLRLSATSAEKKS